VAAAWTTDRKALTIAVIHPTESPQTLSLQVRGAELSGKGVLRRMAPESLTATVVVGEEPGVTLDEQLLNGLPESPTLPPWSVSLYELAVR